MAKKVTNNVILCFDGDDAGRNASDNLKNTLTGLDALCVTADISGSHKDANEALLDDREKFHCVVEDAVTSCEMTLAEEKETYRDKFRRRGEWTAYTDMDLGVTFATPPGSTAKVMSALAGLRKLDETMP